MRMHTLDLLFCLFAGRTVVRLLGEPTPRDHAELLARALEQLGVHLHRKRIQTHIRIDAHAESKRKMHARFTGGDAMYMRGDVQAVETYILRAWHVASGTRSEASATGATGGDGKERTAQRRVPRRNKRGEQRAPALSWGMYWQTSTRPNIM